MVRALAGDSTITRRVPPPLLAALSLPAARFPAGGVLAATHSPSSPAPVPGPVLSIARCCFWVPQPANLRPAELCCLTLGLAKPPGQVCVLKPACPTRPRLLFNSEGRRGCSLTHPGCSDSRAGEYFASAD